MSLIETINNDIKTAMKSRNEGTLRALRGIKSALLLAQTEKGASAELSSEKEIQILQKLVKQRRESLDIYRQQGRNDLADQEQEEISVIETYLPAPLSEAELETIIQQIIQDTGATSPAQMGMVMGAATKQLAGKADGKTISAMVKKLLGS